MRTIVVLHGFKAEPFRNLCADVACKRLEVIRLAGAHGRFYDNDDSPSEK